MTFWLPKWLAEMIRAPSSVLPRLFKPFKGVSSRAFTHAPHVCLPLLYPPSRACEATYAAVTLCRGNGHDEVVAIRGVAPRQPPIRVVTFSASARLWKVKIGQC